VRDGRPQGEQPAECQPRRNCHQLNIIRNDRHHARRGTGGGFRRCMHSHILSVHRRGLHLGQIDGHEAITKHHPRNFVRSTPNNHARSGRWAASLSRANKFSPRTCDIAMRTTHSCTAQSITLCTKSTALHTAPAATTSAPFVLSACPPPSALAADGIPRRIWGHHLRPFVDEAVRRRDLDHPRRQPPHAVLPAREQHPFELCRRKPR
jgi:hypothetical protein